MIDGHTGCSLANSENYIRACKTGWGRGWYHENVSGKRNFKVVLKSKPIYFIYNYVYLLYPKQVNFSYETTTFGAQNSEESQLKLFWIHVRSPIKNQNHTPFTHNLHEFDSLFTLHSTVPRLWKRTLFTLIFGWAWNPLVIRITPPPPFKDCLTLVFRNIFDLSKTVIDLIIFSCLRWNIMFLLWVWMIL